MTPCVRKLATAKKYREDCGRRSWKKGSIGRPGAAVRGARKDAECSSWREWFHAAALLCGGERSWISTAESLSMTFIAPPHLGQRQRPSASSVGATCCPAVAARSPSSFCSNPPLDVSRLVHTSTWKARCQETHIATDKRSEKILMRGPGAVPEKSFRAQRLYDVDAGGAGGWEHRSDYRRA